MPGLVKIVLFYCSYLPDLGRVSGNEIVRDPRFEQLPCLHKGTYTDDCLVETITQHKFYIVAICDKDLKRRIWKVN